MAAFLLNAAFGLVQIAGGVEGLYGFLRPGGAPIWAPSLDDLLDHAVVDQPCAASNDSSLTPSSRGYLSRSAAVPEQPFRLER